MTLILFTSLLLMMRESVTPRNAGHLPLLHRHLPPLQHRDLKACETQPCPKGTLCATVSADDHIIMNHVKLMPGKWCLPDNVPQCNVHTGKLIWSVEKGWQCTCLYPDVVNGESCANLVACDGKGVLVDQQGKAWDYKTNPYTQQLQCQCKEGVALEGDPLRCHSDPCYTEDQEGRANLYDSGACQCQRLFYVESNVDGKCRPPPDQCNWDMHDKTCHCGPGLSAVFCQSSLYQREASITDQCDGNSAGCQCKQACPSCENNGIIEQHEVEPGKFECSCKCPTVAPFKYYGSTCEKTCLIKGTEVPLGEDYRCCKGIASPWCENPPLCSVMSNTCL